MTQSLYCLMHSREYMKLIYGIFIIQFLTPTLVFLVLCLLYLVVALVSKSFKRYVLLFFFVCLYLTYQSSLTTLIIQFLSCRKISQ